MKKVFLFALIAIVMCACSDNMMLNEPVENTVLSRSNEQTTVSNDYTVTPEMVCKYLNIARKGKTIDSITPVIEDGDTLAYVAQYTGNNGWDLISGDKRVAPVLAFCETGTLNLNATERPAINALNGMTQVVKEAKNDTIKHAIWESLEVKEYNNKPQSRGSGYIGKWIATDTVYNNYYDRVPHIITTKWGQKNPWNIYTPLGWFKDDAENNGVYGIRHCAVGCGAVAVGQFIYHFRKNNNRGITLPTTVTFADSIVGSTPIFSNFSTSGWNGMANTQNGSGTAATARFLSYMGKQMNSEYGENTGTHPDSTMSILNQYKLAGNDTLGFDYQKTIAALDASKPILIAGDYYNYKTDSIIGDGHIFIIDGYRKSYEETYVEYVFDPNYNVTEEEYNSEDQSLFEWPEKEEGDPYSETVTRRIYWNYEYQTHIQMNWGSDGEGDDYYYLVYDSYKTSINSTPRETILPPMWRPNESYVCNRVDFILYDVTEMP